MIDEAPPGQTCAYCGTRVYEVAARVRDGTAVRCVGCRLVRTLPYPTFEYAENVGNPLRYAGIEDLYAGFARNILAFISRYARGGELLDVGCGMGILVEEAGRQGFAAHGVELNRREVELTQARGLDVHGGTLEEVAFPGESFDVVCMSHVLEHILDLRSVLHEVHRILRPGGLLVVTQPNYADPLPHMLGHLWYGWQWGQHVWHFDVPTLTRVLADHHLERIATVYNSLDHPWLPRPATWKPKVLAVQAGTAAIARAETWFGRGDQFMLAARRAE